MTSLTCDCPSRRQPVRSTRSHPFTVSRASIVAESRPGPQSTMSGWPSRASRRSFAVPPKSLSRPGPPITRSSPPRPLRTSSPPRPRSVSSRVVPFKVSPLARARLRDSPRALLCRLGRNRLDRCRRRGGQGAGASLAPLRSRQARRRPPAPIVVTDAAAGVRSERAARVGGAYLEEVRSALERISGGRRAGVPGSGVKPTLEGRPRFGRRERERHRRHRGRRRH